MQIYGIKIFNVGRFGEENNSIVFDILPEDQERIENGSLTIDRLYEELKSNPSSYVKKVKDHGISDLISICGIKGNDYDRSNGVGKTTVLEAICYAHYDRILKKSVADKVEKAGLSVVTKINGKHPKDLSESYVEEIFEEGGKIYRIKRGRKFTSSHKNSTPLVEFESINEDDVESQAGHRTTDTNESIALVTPWDYDVFVNGAMFGQGDAGKFLSGTDKIRKEIMINLLRLENVVQGCIDRIREKKNTKTKEIEALNGQLELIKEAIEGRRSVEETEKIVSETEVLITQYEKEASEINESVEKLSKSDEIKRLESIKEEGRQIKLSLESQEKQKESQIKEWKTLIENSKSKQVSQTKKIEETEGRIKSSKVSIESKKKVVEEFDMEEKQKDLSTVEKAKSAEPIFAKKADDLKKKAEGFLEEMTKVSSDHSRINEEQESLLNQLKAAGDNDQFICDKCKSTVSRDHVQGEINKNAELLKEYSGKQNVIKENREKNIKETNEVAVKAKKIEEWLRKEEKIKSEIKSYNDDRMRIKEIEVSLGEQQDSLSELKKDLDLEIKNQKEYGDKISEIEGKYSKDIKELKNKLAELSEKYKSAKKESEEIEARIASLKFKKDGLSKQKSDCNLKIGSLKKDIENAEKDKKKLLELQKKIEEENKVLHRYLVLESVFGLEGIQTRIVKKYLPLLNIYIKEFLDIVTKGEISVEIFINNRSKVDIKLRGGTASEYYLLSGGEKMVVRLAVNVGLALLSFSRSAQKPDIICLDEIFGPLDNCYMDGVFRLLKVLREKFGRIIIISHKPEINEKINHKILLEKGEGDYGRTSVRSIT